MKIRDRVLVCAILFSAVWHIFWLSAFKVVVVPKVKSPVRFSSVSFLGPILGRSVLNVNIKPRQTTSQETVYLDSIETGNLFLSANDIIRGADALPVFDALSAADEEEFTALAVAKIDTNKMEPGRDVD